MKTAKKSFGDPYICQQSWDEDMLVQCGEKGIVFSDSGNYSTAFFEAFPEKPHCFVRGEGNSLKEAEKNCWDKYQKILTCDHEMERRKRTDGYGYCKHCSYSSMVFEPLTKCCKCKKLTAYDTDHKGNWYCKKHSTTKPKNPNPSFFGDDEDRRLPRKEKKLLKKAAEYHFKVAGINGRVIFSYLCYPKFTCSDKRINLISSRIRKTLIQSYRERNE